MKKLQTIEERISPHFLDLLRGEFNKMHDHIESTKERTSP